MQTSLGARILRDLTPFLKLFSTPRITHLDNIFTMPRPGAANQPWSDVAKAGQVWKADAHPLRKKRIQDESLPEANNKGSFLAHVQNNACARHRNSIRCFCDKACLQRQCPTIEKREYWTEA
jgi:hypothetical protein